MKRNLSKFLFAFLVTGLVLVPLAKNSAQEAPAADSVEIEATAEAAMEVTAEGAAGSATETVKAKAGEAATEVVKQTTAATTPEGVAVSESGSVKEETADTVTEVSAETVTEVTDEGVTQVELVHVATGAQPKGMFSRHADPIVLKGEQVPKFEGAMEDMLRVFANTTGRLQPIPYQMDERNQWGEFVVAKGKRVVPDDDDGAFDENDEIVFLTKNLGNKTPKDQWPSGYKEAYEIEVTDPLTSTKGYAYVLSYDSAGAAPAPSTEDYISYEEKGDGVTHGLNYKLGFVNVSSGLDYDILTVTPAAGGSGEDYFDKLKVRVMQNLKRWMTLGISTRLDRTEKNFLVKVYGYKDGPVRVLRVMKVNLQLIWKLPAPGATVNSVFYPEWIEWPVPINLPFKPSWAFYNIELDVSHDYDFKVTDGVKVFSSHDGVWNLVDGQMSASETEVNKEDVSGGYYGFDATASGHGAGFYTVRPPKSFSTTILGLYSDDTDSGLEPEYYKGDGNKKDREEWVKGALPLAGARFVDWDDVGKGIHTVFWYHFYPPFYQTGDEKAFLDIIDHPIQVTVN